MIAFLDATALIYLVDGEARWAEATQAPLHQLAVEAPDLALATAAVGDQACLDRFEAFCQQPGVSMGAAEHAGWEVFHQLLCSSGLPPRFCTDAYLAALAIANGWRLVSFDRDFERFEGLERLTLL